MLPRSTAIPKTGQLLQHFQVGKRTALRAGRFYLLLYRTKICILSIQQSSSTVGELPSNNNILASLPGHIGCLEGDISSSEAHVFKGAFTYSSHSVVDCAIFGYIVGFLHRRHGCTRSLVVNAGGSLGCIPLYFVGTITRNPFCKRERDKKIKWEILEYGLPALISEYNRTECGCPSVDVTST
jgi:hypothetical protein